MAKARTSPSKIEPKMAQNRPMGSENDFGYAPDIRPICALDTFGGQFRFDFFCFRGLRCFWHSGFRFQSSFSLPPVHVRPGQIKVVARRANAVSPCISDLAAILVHRHQPVAVLGMLATAIIFAHPGQYPNSWLLMDASCKMQLYGLAIITPASAQTAGF